MEKLENLYQLKILLEKNLIYTKIYHINKIISSSS